MQITYIWTTKLEKKMSPPVKQFKTIVEKINMKYAPFLSHRKIAITPGALRAAIEET